MSHGPDCVGEAMVRVQEERQKGNKGPRDRVIVQAGGKRGSNGEVVSKEISILIIVACGHDKGSRLHPLHDHRPLQASTPARFIQVHMTNNLYIIARLTASGADYHGEIHAAPVNNVDSPPECLTDTALRMFAHTFLALDCVNEAIGRIRDRSLEAKIRHHQGISLHMEVNEEKHVRLERERQQLELDLGLCIHRLQEARACNRILEEMVSDQHINCHFPAQRNEHGCSG